MTLVDRERLAAAAGGGGVGVLDREAAARDGVDEIDFGAVQVADADRVDIELHAVRFEHLIARALAVLFDHEAVLEAGTAAALHEYPQATAGFLLFHQQLVDLGGSRFRYVNHANIIARRWGTWRFPEENGPKCSKRPSGAG